MRDSNRCVPVKHVAEFNRMRGQTSTKTHTKFFVDPEDENQNSSTWKAMSVTNAVAVRLVALGGCERELSPPRSQVYVFPA